MALITWPGKGMNNAETSICRADSALGPGKDRFLYTTSTTSSQFSTDQKHSYFFEEVLENEKVSSTLVPSPVANGSGAVARLADSPGNREPRAHPPPSWTIS